MTQKQLPVPTQERQPGARGWETIRFAKQRKKNRKANKLARKARKR